MADVVIQDNDTTSLQLKIIALDRILYDAHIKQAAIKTTGGEMVILKDHMPIAAILEDAPVFIIDAEGDEEIIAVHGGYMSVLNNEFLIVADDAIFAKEIDDARVHESILRNEELLVQGQVDAMKLARAEVQLKRDIMNLKVYDLYKKK